MARRVTGKLQDMHNLLSELSIPAPAKEIQELVKHHTSQWLAERRAVLSGDRSEIQELNERRWEMVDAIDSSVRLARSKEDAAPALDSVGALCDRLAIAFVRAEQLADDQELAPRALVLLEETCEGVLADLKQLHQGIRRPMSVHIVKRYKPSAGSQ